MRVALLVVAFMATVALVSAASASLTLSGTYYTDNACTLPSGGYPVTLATTATSGGGGTYSLACAMVGTGTGASSTVLTGSCTTSSEGAGAVNEWAIQVYTGATCPASGSTGTASGPQGGTVTSVAADTSSTLKYPDTQAVTGFSTGTTGCFIASGCSFSGASTLVAPTFLLVALAFVARKLSL